MAPATAAAAGSCPNEQARIAEPYAPALADCRAYEQVSPVEKNYADALGAITSVRAAPSGEAVTFDSLGTFPLGGGSSGEGSSQLFSTYLSARGAEGWPTQNLEPAVNPGGSASPLAVTEDLAYTFELSSNEPPLSSEPGLVEGRQAVYMRDNQTGAYRLLFQLAAGESASFFFVAAAAERLAGLLRIQQPASVPKPRWACATSMNGTKDSWPWSICFPAARPRTAARRAGAAQGPRKKRSNCPTTRTGRCPTSQKTPYPKTARGSTSPTSRTEHLYLRESAPGGAGETLEVSSGPAGWQAATPDGSQAFYIEGGVLYRFDAQAATGGQWTALTPAGAEVQGVLGVGGDGSYVYFAAKGVLAAGGVSGAGNIYEWHEGAIALVSSGGEEDDWTRTRCCMTGSSRGP